jgi:hypothetical protein
MVADVTDVPTKSNRLPRVKWLSIRELVRFTGSFFLVATVTPLFGSAPGRPIRHGGAY